MFSIDTNNEKIRIIFWKFDSIILFSEFVGKKPPPEMRDMVIFNELKSLTPDILKSIKIPKLKIQ